MPTYTYRCQSCGHQFDIFQKFSDDPLKECPACHGALKKVLHPVGVVFKGSGWYITDSRPAQSSENGGSEKAESDKSDTKDKSASTNGKSGDTAKTAASAESTSSAAKSETKPKTAATSEN